MLSSSSSNHNQNRYQAVVGTSPHTRSCCVYMLSTWVRWRHLSPCCIQAVSRCSACCFPFFTSSPSSCRGCSLCFFVDLHRLVLAVFCPFCPLSPVCRLTVLQSSSKPLPSSSLSSLSRRPQPLKVVNRKRPPRDDWNNYSTQGDHEADRASLGMDQDTCIKVRSWKSL